jgi:predicted ATPase
MRGELQTAHKLATQLLRLAQRMRQAELLVEAHFALGITLSSLGEFTHAREHWERGIALLNPQQNRSHAFLYGQDPGVACLAWTADVLWYLGYPDQALERSQQAVTLARKLSHPHSLAYALGHVVSLHQYRQEEQAVQEWTQAAITLSTEQGFTFWLALGMIYRGWSLVEQGQGEEGIAQMRQGLAAYRATGAVILQPVYLAMLVEAYEKMGQREEGLHVLTEALAVVDKTGERLHEAELYRLKGELSLRSRSPKSEVKTSLGQVQDKSKTSQDKSRVRSPEAEVEECFWKAIEIARKQQAKSLELRATVSLARLWQQQGKKKQARQMLAEVYRWFTEGFDTADLEEAKALLDTLS